MRESSFTLYTPRDAGLHRLHPLTKLALVAFCVIAALVLPGLWPAYAVFVLLLVPLALWGQLLRPLLGAAWKIVLPFAISVFLIQGLFWTGGTPVATLGPLSLKAEGLAFATRSTGRILAIVSGFLIFALATRPDHLMIALAERGVPSSVTYIILASIQIVPTFQAKANTILDAQRARGLETEGGLRQRVRALLPLVEPLILGSLIDIDERAIALEARAFGRSGPKTFLRTLADTRWQVALRWFLLLAAVALLIGRLVLIVRA